MTHEYAGGRDVAVHPSAPPERLHFVGKIALWVLLIAVFEGAIRKWIYEDVTIPLMLARDGLVVWAILAGLRRRWFRFGRSSEILLLFWSLVLLVLVGFQVIFTDQPAVVFGIGLRGWLLYFWFSVLCSRTLNVHDVEIVLRKLSYLLIPMAALALFQHVMPVGAFINRQPGGDESGIFRITEDIVRPAGTFSFTAGFTQFVIFSMIYATLIYFGEIRSRSSGIMRAIIFLSMVTCVAVSGSRTAIIISVAIFLTAVLSSTLTRGFSYSAIARLISLVIIIAMLSQTLFSRALEATTYRFSDASESESLSGRMAWMFVGDFENLTKVPLLGYGVGVGANASRQFVHGDDGGFFLAESENQRIIMEAGIVGMLMVFIKLVISVRGTISAIFLFRRKRVMLPMLIWLFVAVELLTMPVMNQLTVHAFAWIGLGLGWASLNAVGFRTPSNDAIRGRCGMK